MCHLHQLSVQSTVGLFVGVFHGPSVIGVRDGLDDG